MNEYDEGYLVLALQLFLDEIYLPAIHALVAELRYLQRRTMQTNVLVFDILNDICDDLLWRLIF